MADATSIGERVAALRQLLGLTQMELGQRLGVTQSTIARWEQGGKAPRASALRRFEDLERRASHPEAESRRLEGPVATVQITIQVPISRLHNAFDILQREMAWAFLDITLQQ